MDLIKIPEYWFFAIIVAAVCLCVRPSPVNSAPIAYAELCDIATAKAAQGSGVPVKIMQAIARAETGTTRDQKFIPWPWTVNVAGQGRFFADRQRAISHVRAQLKSGESNIDIGCFQINQHWHGENFASIEDMIDPDLNAQYAATFLSILYEEFGDWDLAIAAFHSRNPEASRPYMARLRPILHELKTASHNTYAPKKRSSIPSHNGFPLIGGTSNSQSSGSLFPVLPRTNGSFFGSRDDRG